MLLLDTHAWVWFVANPEKLSGPAQEAIDKVVAVEEVLVSSMSVWEVAMLVARGRLKLTMDVDQWVARSEALPFLTFVPVDNRVAMASVRLPPPLHKDPADRIIAATALKLGIPLVTKDQRLLDYEPVHTIW
jgi:PIN domain nuclease of toxin-antitoxin system